MADILRFSNREVFFQKAITAPELGTKTVLARDAFQYVELWLKRQRQAEALFYWTQAKSFHSATKLLPATSAPLTAYYCMLNATKALLVVKGISFSESHGVSGSAASSRSSLVNEISKLQNSGVAAELSRHLNEKELRRSHSLEDILANLPFIHRAYTLTRRKSSGLFMALSNVAYVRHPTQNKIWLEGEVEGLDADRRVLRHMPPGFEIDEGIEDRWVIRRKARISWFPKRGASQDDKDRSLARLREYHRKLRVDVVSISAAKGLWYLKRRISSINSIDRYGLTLMLLGMHRLSELARYDPKGLSLHLSGSANWLLTEFIELAPSQFIDEMACEITGLEFRMPGVRS
ncbi:hypothetical protein EQZ23_15730 [Sphingomonas sp. UV9]|uniref:YaaC family protein n=1 Tax=Sphingomonas sp. UV9 TaxID=1851410 RepID=UPI000FFC7E3A|nr:YaaC family protein [Sphingomonas sp. UV9]RXD03759.1 hypothetical protein EQZ23_15730 [Sphingomonas sp. UV9]